jgi:hypothetical protein
MAVEELSLKVSYTRRKESSTPSYRHYYVDVEDSTLKTPSTNHHRGTNLLKYYTKDC